MTTNQSPRDIERLLAEAEELAQRINAKILDELEEEHRLQFEIHAQNLKRIKSEVQSKIEEKGTSGISSGADGMHEAIQDIVKAMKNFKNYIF